MRLMKNFVEHFIKLFKRSKTADLHSNLYYRKTGLLRQIDFLATTLENAKFDIVYMENLKMPLTPDENIYFLQQVDKINSSLKLLAYMQKNINENESYWKKFLRW